MKISAYIHAHRCGLPCGGVGRHANSMLLELATRPNIELSILTSKSDVSGDGKLPINFPLRELPTKTYPFPERWIEPVWKLTGLPKIDPWLSEGTDWLYSPMDAYLPTPKCPVAITIHDVQTFETGLPWSYSKQEVSMRRRLKMWIPKVLRESKKILTVSEFSRLRLIELLGADPKKIFVVGNGVDPIFFDIGSECRAPDLEHPYLFVIGGLRYRKGANETLALARTLKNMGSPLHILVAGVSDGCYVKEAEAIGNVLCLGSIDDTKMTDLLSRAVSLLFLSLYEGFGIPVLEAMACGVPTISSKIASLPEVAGEAGILVDPYDSRSVAESAEKLRTQKNLRADIVATAKLHVKNRTWKKCVDQLLECLD